jgi:hypothetical protein
MSNLSSDPILFNKNTMNLSRFRLKSSSQHFKKHLFNFSRWVDRSLKSIKLSRKIFMNTSMFMKILIAPKDQHKITFVKDWEAFVWVVMILKTCPKRYKFHVQQ